MNQCNRVARCGWIVLCACLLVVGCEPRANNGEPPQQAGMDYYIQGARFYHAGQRDEAILLLEKAVAANPSLRMARELLGDAYRAKGDYEQALVHYNAASKLDPYSAVTQYNLGVANQLLNHLQEAAAAYLRALRLNPKDVKSNMNLGLVYLALGQNDDAITHLRRATKLDPNFALAWSNLGVALDAKGDITEAESVYRKALELDSKNIVTLQNLAQNLIAQGKASEALAIMDQVLLRTDSPSIRKRYGDALAMAKRFDEALVQYDMTLKAEPRNIGAMNEKAFVLITKYVDGLELDDSERLTALTLWRNSLKMNPNQPRVSEALAKWEKPGLFGD
jgi:tetratricopeptide (TPR) repeat protein